ncbi:carboxypeptidase regulatory-like domain-containing protein [Agarivorans sp. 1_MG-2023]|uniref:carboxypeptidase regulatory-like domain-containing protein n=1 Tax=Agarivorans sp. 1_MG-2023 TaxID=3062634 RepID=UPI0034C6506E
MIEMLKTYILAACFALVVGCGGSNSDNASDPGAEPQESYQITVTVLDANSQLPLADAQVSIAEQAQASDQQGYSSFELAVGSYSLSVSLAGYQAHQQAIEIGEQDVSLTLSLEALPTVSGPLYVFHSDNDSSYSIEHWGDNWGSGSVISDVTDPNIGKALNITSGTVWGNKAAIAWGNEPENAVAIDAYTHLKFKVKANSFTAVEVVLQGPSNPESKIAYALSTGAPLDDGWLEMEVPLPYGFSQLTWLGLIFDSSISDSLGLSDVYLLSQEMITSQPSAAAPQPPALADNEAVVIFSDSLPQDHYVSVWNANWWSAPFYSPGAIDDNDYARYEIAGLGVEGGVTGIEFGIENGSVDASSHVNMNLDVYLETGISRMEIHLVSNDGSALYTVASPQTEQWVSYQIPFAAMQDADGDGDGVLNPASLTMAGIKLWGEQGKAVFLDNLYFSGQSNVFELAVTVLNPSAQAISGALVTVGEQTATTNTSGVAYLTLAEGEHKVKADASGFGAAQQNQQLLGGDATLEIVLTAENPAPSVAADNPSVSDEDVLVLYSDSLLVDKPISYWSDNWWNAPSYSEIQLAGNNVARLQIIPDGVEGGVTGIQFGIQDGVLDASAMTGLRFDMYATRGVSQAVFQVVSATGPVIHTMLPVVTEQWVSVELVFTDMVQPGSFDAASLSQLGVQLWGTTSDSVYLDNIYFY